MPTLWEVVNSDLVEYERAGWSRGYRVGSGIDTSTTIDTLSTYLNSLDPLQAQAWKESYELAYNRAITQNT